MDIPTKAIVVNNAEYKLTRFSAREGSWLVSQFFEQMYGGIGKEVSEQQLALAITATFSSFPEATFNRIRVIALKSVLKGDPGEPLVMADGKEVVKLSSVDDLALTAASLAFNLHCFFEPGAAETLKAVFPDLSQPSSPGSTATS